MISLTVNRYKRTTHTLKNRGTNPKVHIMNNETLANF